MDTKQKISELKHSIEVLNRLNFERFDDLVADAANNLIAECRAEKARLELCKV